MSSRDGVDCGLYGLVTLGLFAWDAHAHGHTGGSLVLAALGVAWGAGWVWGTR